jgi:uncharacterized protein (DUF983 family)
MSRCRLATTEDRVPGRFTPLANGVRMRCPRCGSGGIFASFFELHETCPSCDFRFEREEGYWLGAMIVIFALVETVYGLAFLGTVLATYPDVPWTAMLVLGLVLNAVVPVVGYPWAKTAWSGLHAAFAPSVLTGEVERHVPGARRE